MNPAQEYREQREAETKRWQKAINAGRRVEELLRALPDDGRTYYEQYSDLVHVDYYRPTDAEATRSGVNAVLRSVVAKRDVNKSTGQVSYVFDTAGLKVTVHGGGLAPNCRIEEYQETVTRYRSVCEDDSSVVVGAESS